MAIQSVSQKKHSNKYVVAGLAGSLAAGSLHGLSKEFEVDTLNSSAEYRQKMKNFLTNKQWDEFINLINQPKRLAMRMKILKKILYPIDNHIFDWISKLPKGEKLVHYLNKSSKFPKKLFGKIHYNPVQMTKGAAFIGSIYLITVGIAKGIHKIFNKNKKGE